MRIAFHAPLKAPDHPVPSGDRRMARLLVAALEAGGHTVDLVSRLRTYAADADPQRLARIGAEAQAEVERIDRAWSIPGAARPDLWFTYHPFYKAPDLLGPVLARRFNLAYVTAEASHAPKRAAGPWAAWHEGNAAAIRDAALHVCFTDRDRCGLESLIGPGETLVMLPPFIDACLAEPRARSADGTVGLVTVAMMRPGDKLASYGILARALAALPPTPAWHITLIGDGPARGSVEAAFAGLPHERITWRGLLGAAAIADALDAADLFVWPGVNEAYGLVYLEAAAAGLPALAFDTGGIASVIEAGRTGLLVPDDSPEAYAEALVLLIHDGALRRRLGDAARTMVVSQRSVAGAAEILDRALRRAVAAATARPA